MIPEQKLLFAECVKLAPDFRVQVGYTNAMFTSRVLTWSGTAHGVPKTGSYPFPPGRDFEPIYDVLLQNAVIALR